MTYFILLDALSSREISRTASPHGSDGTFDSKGKRDLKKECSVSPLQIK